jgi:hypothetical protein
VRSVPATVGLLGMLAVTGGCGGNDEAVDARSGRDAPAAGVIAEAAAATFSEPTLALSLSVASKGGSYVATGLVEPEDGRFRVQSEQVRSRHEFVPPAVIGLGGEGFEKTVAEGGERLVEGFPGNGQRCWFNPHAPVGSFLGTASVEESVRVTGAVLESLRDEVEQAEGSGGSRYAVELQPSASRPRDDFRDRPERVWGDRRLLESLERPVEVGLAPDGERVESIALELRDYRVYDAEARVDMPNIDSVRIEAKLVSTDRRLVIDPPRCQALE